MIRLCRRQLEICFGHWSGSDGPLWHMELKPQAFAISSSPSSRPIPTLRTIIRFLHHRWLLLLAFTTVIVTVAVAVVVKVGRTSCTMAVGGSWCKYGGMAVESGVTVDLHLLLLPLPSLFLFFFLLIYSFYALFFSFNFFA